MDGDGSAPFSQTMTQSSGVEYFELLLVQFRKDCQEKLGRPPERGKKSFTIRGFLFSFGLESN